MESRITASELARKLGDVLGRVRFRRDVFVVERHGEAVARLTPVPTGDRDESVDEALRAWAEGSLKDDRFADDLERINSADRPPTNPWG